VRSIEKIGFIGLGTMGRAMAGNLIKGGFEVYGFDIDPAAVEALMAAGSGSAPSPREAARAADLVITMLPNAPDVEAVLSGPAGVLAVAAEGRRLMNCSTIDPAEARGLAALASGAGWSYIDCPVGRTAADAAAGTSLFMFGGDESDKQAVRPVLEAMGNAIVDCGAVGQASTIKIVNNYLSITAAVATAEALALAAAGDVPPEAAFRVINNTIAMNGHTKTNFPKKVLAGDVEPGFSIDLAYKDLGIAMAAMKREGIPCFLGRSAQVAYEEARRRGQGSRDWSDLYNLLRTLWKERKG